MTPLRLKTGLRRRRRRLAIVLAMLFLGCAIAAHHAAPPMPGMAAAVCVAVVGTAAAAVALLIGPRPWLTRLPDLSKSVPPLIAHELRLQPARAGPIYTELQVLRR